MSSTTEIALVETGRLAALERLNPTEMSLYEKKCRSGKPDLSPETNKRLMELYFHGLSIQDMKKMNPALSTEDLIKARVDGRWDERKDEYLGELLGDMASRLKQTAAEALSFMSLQLATMHKKHGEAMKRYLQTGDESQLHGSGLVPESIKEQKAIIESIAKLLEAGKDKGSSSPMGTGGPLVSVTAAPGSNVTLSSPEGASQRFSPEEADAIRAFMEDKKR